MKDHHQTSTNMPYMYASVGKNIEAERLDLLNQLHNPYMLKNLAPYAAKSHKILELGCGSGQLADELLALCNPDIHYVGIDQDNEQIAQTSQRLKTYQNVELLNINLLESLSQLETYGPFDLIYCRWVLVHLPKNKITHVLSALSRLLSKEGVFICDECDNRAVSFIAAKQSHKELTDKANHLWKALSLGLMQKLGNNLELSSEVLGQLLVNTSSDRTQVELLDEYQVLLKSYDEKSLITKGYLSSEALIESINVGIPFSEVIDIFNQCALEPDIQVKFLKQSIMKLSRVL